jgi:hypothetical protein
MRHLFLILITVVLVKSSNSRPKISCEDLKTNFQFNNTEALSNKLFQGFVFPKGNQHILFKREDLLTPDLVDIITSEGILTKSDYGFPRKHKSQYAGVNAANSNSLLY